MKKIIKTTVEEYDENGKLIKRTITETTEESNDNYSPWIINPNPVQPYTPYTPIWTDSPTTSPYGYTITCQNKGATS